MRTFAETVVFLILALSVLLATIVTLVLVLVLAEAAVEHFFGVASRLDANAAALFNDLATPLFTFASVAVAAFTYWHARSADRRQRAVTAAREFILEFRQSDYFMGLKASRNIAFPEGTIVTHPMWEAAKYSADRGEIDAANALIEMLNVYETVAHSTRRGEMDEQVLKGSLRSNLLNLMNDVRPLVQHFRLENPKLFENLDWLTAKWGNK